MRVYKVSIFNLCFWMIIVLNFLIISCKQRVKYQIYGKVKGCEGCSVDFYTWDLINRIDTTSVKNDHFFLEGKINQPDFYELGVFNKKNNYPALIYVDSNPLRINFTFKFREGLPPLYPTVFSISIIQNQLNNYMKIRDSIFNVFYQKKNAMNDRFTQSMKGNDQLMYRLADSLNKITDSLNYYLGQPAELFTRRYPNSIAAPFVLLESLNNRSDFITYQQLYNSLSQKVAKSKYGKLLANKISEYAEQTRELIKDTITYLNVVDTIGNQLNLKKIINSNKLILVNFWASWCGSCREEIPKLNELYKEYHARGFDMIAVSIDNDRQNWLKAIREIRSPAHDVIELKGEFGQDVKHYKIQALPFNFIANQNGIIIASNIYPDSIKNIIKNILN